MFLKNSSLIPLDKLSDSLIDKNSLDNDKLQAMFYVLIFCLFFVMGISSLKKGLVFIINYFILFVAFGFLFFDYYYEHKHRWIKKAQSYCFIVSGCFMWIIGIIKFINHAFLAKETTILLGNSD